MVPITLRHFVGNTPTFVRKIPTHDVKCRNNSYMCRSTCVRIIPTLVEICRNYSCTAKRRLTLYAFFLQTSTVWEYFLQNSAKILNKALHM